LEKEPSFFVDHAKDKLLEVIKNTLQKYGIIFDEWFSEKKLHEDGAVSEILKLLKNKNLTYEHEGALWFKATKFGDDKDRVVKKSSGDVTYIASDIAYHKNKFDRGFDVLIDVLGQDHHGYIKRLKATMQALGYEEKPLNLILYQLVSIKKNDQLVRMSKRTGAFTKLQEIIDTVGKDVTRFFYLNRKAEAHLEFDLETALKKTDANPVFYIQYAYVRTKSLLGKAEEEKYFKEFVQQMQQFCLAVKEKNEINVFPLTDILQHIGDGEINVIKKIISFVDILKIIETSYQTHLLAYYAWELANSFHTYYANHRIVDTNQPEITKMRLLLAMLVQNTLHINLNLLGVSAPEKM